MTNIVCAIRGGSFSIPTIDRAITMAYESNLPLCFRYVADTEAFSHLEKSRFRSNEKKLRQMGDTILQLAEMRAEGLGVKANRIIRSGNVINEIRCLCRDLKA
jgi:hypothetical protein